MALDLIHVDQCTFLQVERSGHPLVVLSVAITVELYRLSARVCLARGRHRYTTTKVPHQTSCANRRHCSLLICYPLRAIFCKLGNIEECGVGTGSVVSMVEAGLIAK